LRPLSILKQIAYTFHMASSKPLALSLGAVSLTTAILVAVDNGAALEHLEIAYLFPTALIAVCYGSNFAFLTSCASAITAAYFLFPPKFSLHIANPLHIAELGFFVLLSVIAGKIVALLSHDAPLSASGAGNRDRGVEKRRGNSALRTIAEEQTDLVRRAAPSLPPNID
jgi:K+-sensing histidine kinase KdpD